MNEGLHYANLNIHALKKLGSIEIRGMRGALHPEEVVTWVSILERIYKMSATYTDPREICEGLSGVGPVSFVKEIFGERFDEITEAIGWNHQKLSESAWEGIRLAQDLCYCRDWSKYEKPDFDEDPFGRRTASSNPYTGQAPMMAATQAHSLSVAVPTPPPFFSEEEEENYGPEYDEDFEPEENGW